MDRFDRTDGDYARARKRLRGTTWDSLTGAFQGEAVKADSTHTERIQLGDEGSRRGRYTLKCDTIPVRVALAYEHGGVFQAWNVNLDYGLPENLPQLAAPWTFEGVHMTLALHVSHKWIHGSNYYIEFYPTKRRDESISLRWLDVEYAP